MATIEYILYCDESDDSGEYYSNFYGGVLVGSHHLDECKKRLSDKKAEHNLHGEIKWQKITENYKEKYIAIVDEFFDLMEEGKLKVRIMFKQNALVPTSLTHDHIEQTYFILYYQFIKHAFGFKYCNNDSDIRIRLRVYLDVLPDKSAKCRGFKEHLHNLSRSPHFEAAQVFIPEDQIAEVISHEHVLLQCLDVVLGAMPFRLNDKHKVIPPGARKRGKRTVAKEAVYKHINQRIRRMLPGFNVGVSTGWRGGIENAWHHPYRHWAFVPSDFEFDGSKTKNGKK